MDEHLNIFYPYSLKEKDNIREDNITRASLIAFETLDKNEKIDFINSLLNRNILDNKEKYEFEIILQPTGVINEQCNKFLVGFCPTGNVSGCKSKAEAVDKIVLSSADHNARADGQINVYKNKKKYLVILFENKFQDLFEDQLKRHFESILKVNKFWKS